MRSAKFLLILSIVTAALAGPAVAQVPDATSSATARYQELEMAWRESVEEWRAKQRAIIDRARASGGAMVPAMRMLPRVGDHIIGFMEAAADHAGTDDAVPFLIWIAHGLGLSAFDWGTAALLASWIPALAASVAVGLRLLLRGTGPGRDLHLGVRRRLERHRHHHQPHLRRRRQLPRHAHDLVVWSDQRDDPERQRHSLALVVG